MLFLLKNSWKFEICDCEFMKACGEQITSFCPTNTISSWFLKSFENKNLNLDYFFTSLTGFLFLLFVRINLIKYLHRGFLQHWNSQKSVSNIWPHFSCLLNEEIPKIWKKLNSHGGFLRADQGRAKMCCQMGWIGCAIL